MYIAKIVANITEKDDVRVPNFKEFINNFLLAKIFL